MRILFIFHYSTLKGGANVSGLNMIAGLSDIGHEIEVLVPAEGELCRRLEVYGIKYKVIPFRQAWPYTSGSLSSIIKFLPASLKGSVINRKAISKIEEMALAFNPDIIHSNSSVMNIGYRVAKRLGIPHVTHYREFGFKDTGFVGWHIPSMQRYTLQYNIAISREIARFHKLKGDNSTLIYNGIYSYADYPVELKSDVERGNYLLYVGGIYRAKGIDEILEAYSRLDKEVRRGHPLWLAGVADSAEYDNAVRRKVESLGLIHDVKWLGHRNDIGELMRRARALIVASRAEAFGRIMAEAAFNGCPVIARDKCGLHEQFEQGRKVSGNEIGLRFNNVEELTEQIQNVLKLDPMEMNKMLEAGYLTAHRLYTNEANAKAVADFYQRILTGE